MEGATLQLPKDLIEAAIQQHVSAAIAQALGGQQRILSEAVTRVLTEKVGSDGKPSSYRSDTDTYVQWLVKDCLRTTVRDVLTEEMKKHQAAIRAQMVKELSSSRSPLVKKLADTFTNSLIDVTADKYRLTIEVKD